MKRSHWGPTIAAAALAACFAGDAQASVPVGVWVRVESVAFEPNEAAATRIQIRGAVMLYDGSSAGPYLGYTNPALGYLYYECPAGKDAACLLEWQDIKKNIGTPPDQCVGFGDQLTPTGTLRMIGVPAVKPDGYPIAMGVTGGFSPCQVLADFLVKQPDGGAGGAGSSSSSSGSTTSTTTATTTATTTVTTTTANTGGSSNTSDPPADVSSGCSIQDGHRAGAFGAALAMVGLAAAFARLGARRKR